MTPVNQRTRDDCFRACVASVLNLRYEDVPHFMEGETTGAVLSDRALNAIDAWFAERGLAHVEVGFSMSPAQVMRDFGHVNSTLTYLMTGRGQRSVNHCVVCRGGEMIHDPGAHLGSNGVTQVCVDGYTRVGLIVVNKPDILETVSKQE